MSDKEKKQIELTDENIRKALETLGVDPDTVIKKSANDAFDQTDEGKIKTKKKKEGEESDSKEDKGEITEGESSEEDKKEEDESDVVEKSVKKVNEKDQGIGVEMVAAIEKSMQILDALQKSVDQKIELLATVNGSLSEKLEKAIDRLGEFDSQFTERLEKALGAMDNKLEKSLHSKEVADLEKLAEKDALIKSLDDRIEKVEKAPNPRKSATLASSYIKKGQYEEEDAMRHGEGNVEVLSLSRDKQRISNMLLQKSGVEDPSMKENPIYRNAVIQFEGGGGINKALMNDISKSEGVKFTS